MAISAAITLWGMYQFDNTILDGLTVPTGMSADTVKDNLLLESASLSILYPDPAFLKKAIELWSAERLEVWQKLYNTTVLQYDPIENYDRIEETLENSSGSSIDQRSHNRTSSETSGETSTGSHSTGKDTSTETRSSGVTASSGENEATASNTAYNSATFADTAKNVSSGSNTSTDSGTSSGTGSETETGSTTENRSGLRSGKEDLAEQGNTSRSDQRSLQSRIHGNIGVTSSQQLIEQERTVAEFCMVDYIINDFISRFCVMVY